jgi:hypothetical protein
MMAHKYADAESGFALGVPAGWRVDTTGLLGSRLILFAPAAAGDFQANVNVTVQGLGGVTRDEFLTVTRIQLKQFAGTPRLEMDAPAAEPAGGHAFGWTSHRHAVPLRGHQVLAFREGWCYAVTLTARPEQFERLRLEFEEILRSFQFIDPTPPAG